MYLLFLEFLILLVNLILLYYNYKIKKQKIEDIEKKYKEKIEQKIQEKLDELNKINKNINQLREFQAIETKHAAQVREQNDQLLASEQDRLTAELNKRKELEEIKLQQDLEKKKEALNLLYQKQYQELNDNYQLNKQKLETEILFLKAELDDFKIRQNAINEIIRKENELNNEIDAHRLILSENDKEDINYLVSIEKNIHNKDLLHKLIWSEYIQKAFNQMIKNSLGSKTPKNVIYCIENIKNHKKYIGKTSAEVTKRWTEHLKNSLDIGGIKKQLIHDALFGHWDEFTFNIIEEVQDEKLSDKEKYYISIFETDKYGYNIKSGG